MVTLESIGSVCGVSKATVSLALRGSPRIPAATRDKIREVASKLGYQVNPLVSAHAAYIRTGRKARAAIALGYLTNWTSNAPTPSKLVNARYLNGASKRADELGYRLDPFYLRSTGMTIRRIGQILATRNILGVVVADLARADAQLDLQWETLAAVALGHALKVPRIHRVCHDQHASMTLLVTKLHGLGFRRIGLAMGRGQDERSGHLILSAYLCYQKQHLEAKRLEPCLPDEWDKKTFLQWYHKNRPDIIVTVLEDVVSWLREDGISVPGRVSVASVCSLNAGMAGIEQHFEEIGSTAVDMLISQLQTNRRGIPRHPQSNLILGSWREAATISSFGRQEPRGLAKPIETDSHP